MKLNFKRSLIFTLILALILSCAPLAFADSVDGWKLVSPLSQGRYYSQEQTLNGKIYVIGGTDRKISLLSVEEYDPITNSWSNRAPMNIARVAFQTAIVNGKIYAIGGASAGIASNSIEVYDPNTNIWTVKAPMKYSRAFFQSQVIDGKIYVFGGCSETSTYKNSTSEMEIYDPETDMWTVAASMNIPRNRFASEVVDGKIYAIGGVSGSTSYLSSVEQYDPQNDKWVNMSDLPTARMSVSKDTTVYAGKIYAIGGYNGSSSLNSVYAYDPLSGSWTLKAQMPISCYYNQIESIDGKIYSLGGSSGATPYNDVIMFDPNANVATKISSMIDSRYNFNTAVINGKIYAISGLSLGLLTSVESYAARSNPTLTVTASPNDLKVGSQFKATVAIHNVSNIYAEDISINYDSSLFDYVGADALPGLKIYEVDTSTPGTVRFIIAHLGTENAANGDKDLINLTLKAKAPGTGKVDITKGRIADNSTLEMDVDEENCGEDTITVEPVKDVNRTGEFTLLDLGIDAGYYGVDASQTDSTRFDTDVVADGVIDDNDLTSITASLLENSNYQPNN